MNGLCLSCFCLTCTFDLPTILIVQARLPTPKTSLKWQVIPIWHHWCNFFQKKAYFCCASEHVCHYNMRGRERQEGEWGKNLCSFVGGTAEIYLSARECMHSHINMGWMERRERDRETVYLHGWHRGLLELAFGGHGIVVVGILTFLFTI